MSVLIAAASFVWTPANGELGLKFVFRFLDLQDVTVRRFSVSGIVDGQQKKAVRILQRMGQVLDV
jgi:hypothetical protein